MAIALLFSLTVVSAGFATLRAMRLANGALGFGLAPAGGLAVLAIASSWSMLLGAPPPWPGVVVFAIALVGLALAIADRAAIGVAATTLMREQAYAVLTLVAALAVPFITMSLAFGGAQVPLSPHDGAFHTESIQALRTGLRSSDWYPPGVAALYAAWLQALPWVDSAQGAFELALSLPTLAGLAVFGLAVAVWHDPRIAAAGALLLSFTYVYPYFPELWSGWPLATALILVVGLWTVSLDYLNRPSLRHAALAGTMLGAIVLTHGSELYTLAVVFPLIVIGALPRVPWRRLPAAVGVTASIGLVCAAPYLPSVLHWAAGGGAYAVGFADGQPPPADAVVSTRTLSSPFQVFALGALGIDLPLRLVGLGIGIGWVLRERRGRSVLAVGGVFAAIASVFALLNGVPLVLQAFATLFPWGMSYRLFMVVAIAQALLAGAGTVVALCWLGRWTSRPTPVARRVGRVLRVLVVTWLGLLVLGMTVYLTYPAQLVLGYTADDAAAMAWLHEHAAPDAVIANDGFADAGIWAPYKAGLEVLLPRSGAPDPNRRALVIDNVARLEQVPEAAAAVCALDVQYVYYGAAESAWDARRFPARELLRAAPGLEEVFTRGGASVFRIRQTCA